MGQPIPGCSIGMSALAGGSVPDSESTSREAENRLLELQRKTRDELCPQRITLH